MATLYFAYGSNMYSKYFSSRIISAKSVGGSYLKDKKVLFNKRSLDGSGKANIVDSPGHVTWGVLYAINASDLEILNRIEIGYSLILVKAWSLDGNLVEAVSYVSTNLTDEPVPYEWYKNLVIAGAIEHDLPKDYIAYLKHFP